MASGGRQAARRAYDIFVARLPWTVGGEELRAYFSQFGKIKSANVPFDKKTGFSRGFGIVQFDSLQDVKTVLQQEVHILDGRRVQVQQSEGTQTNKPERLQINGDYIG